MSEDKMSLEGIEQAVRLEKAIRTSAIALMRDHGYERGDFEAILDEAEDEL